MLKNHILISVLIIGIVAVAVMFIVSELGAVGMALFILAVLALLRVTIMPAGYGATKLRMVCLVAVATLMVGQSGWVASVANALLASSQLAWLPQWARSIRISSEPSLPLMVLAYLVLLTVFYFTRDTSSAGSQAAPADGKDLVIPQDKIEEFCEKLRHDLHALNTQSKWDPDDYAVLEAEVEVRNRHGVAKRKKVLNLQKAIRVDGQLQSCLLLGVPGAGKSVALRRLALYMLGKVKHGRRIPVYINLREWIPKVNVVNGTPSFDFENLKDFVLASITKGEASREAFVSQYFDALLGAGRLYFIFDSFDEISQVLDAGQDEKVIDALSDLLSRFISGGKSKGILASRVFRRPTKLFQAKKVLEIRPLSESAALQGLSRQAGLSYTDCLGLLRKRRELMPLMRNPFMMVLLGDWIRNHGEAPANQAQIFDSFIAKRLEVCAPELAAARVTAEQVISLATEVAWFVFSTASFGLEAPVKALHSQFKPGKIGPVLNVLREAGIARVTTGAAPSFAFVHRRFLEYFVTRRLLANPASAPITDIPTDSRGRDALVLYAQICVPAEAERIAKLCWFEIKAHFDDEAQRMRAIHCLRFLVDAFCFRREAIQSFGDELHQFVEQHVSDCDNLVFAKICLEATGLLPEMKTAPVLSLALGCGDGWLQETAFKGCRYLPRVEKGLQDDIAAYVRNIPDLRFWRSRKGLLLSLSLSDALQGVYTQARLRVINWVFSCFAALALVLVAPKGVAVGGLYALFCLGISQGVAEFFLRKNKPKPGQGNDRQQNSATSTKWLSAGRWERALAVFRYMTVGGLLVFCLMSFVGLLPAPTKGAICVMQVCGIDPVLYQVVCLVLAGLMLDWMVAYKGLSKLLPQLLRAKFWGGLLAVIALCTAAIGLLLWLAINFPEYSGYVNYVYGPVLVFIVLIGFAAAAWAGWKEFKDCRQVDALKFSHDMTRLQIARTLERLRTNNGRAYYVSRLDANQVRATEQWPDGFRLSLGQGDYITALARLEERWLGLDR